jgi:hypothetical protein
LWPGRDRREGLRASEEDLRVGANRRLEHLGLQPHRFVQLPGERDLGQSIGDPQDYGADVVDVLDDAAVVRLSSDSRTDAVGCCAAIADGLVPTVDVRRQGGKMGGKRLVVERSSVRGVTKEARIVVRDGPWNPRICWAMCS